MLFLLPRSLKQTSLLVVSGAVSGGVYRWARSRIFARFLDRFLFKELIIYKNRVIIYLGVDVT
jgi:hypothetical protein